MKKLSMTFIFFILSSIFFSPMVAQASPCVNIYFDRVTPDDWIGKTYSMFLQNLLGHFPRYQQIVSPIQKYQAGDIEKCAASFYIGSSFYSDIPTAFLRDYVATKRNVAWLGYGIWNLQSDFEKLFGYRYDHLTKLDSDLKDQQGHPTFFQDILYKGEVFKKFGDWSRTDATQFLAPFEQSYLVRGDGATGLGTELLAQARHSHTGEIIPYILRAANHFYVADTPFSYLHESDRYLVFADLLFDVLNEKPRHATKYAFVRVEDVHAMTPLSYNYAIVNLLRGENIPINISLIPIFTDPLFRVVNRPLEQFLPMNHKPEFMSFIREQQKQGATFIWHGVTHQYRAQKNPYNGASAADFEFWDATKNGPVDEDSVDYVLDKLNDGWYTLQQSGITPRMWLTPHYQASPLDYLIFASSFSWNVGRVIYFNHSVSGLKCSVAEERLWFSTNDPDGDRLRRDAFHGLSVHLENNPSRGRVNGQFFPYEIYGDVYGQRLIPEDLGNSQPYVSEFVGRSRTAQDIVDTAKRNLVLRDTWASLFYHPFLLSPFEEDGRGMFPGDPAELKFIVENIKALGYQFINIDQFIDEQTLSKRPEPIYKELEL